jgi:tetratricopeptide (TPR) repeat protein
MVKKNSFFKMLVTILSCGSILVTLNGCASFLDKAKYEGDFQYEIEGDGVVIVRYLGKDKDVVIPAQIDSKPVRGIKSKAFFEISAVRPQQGLNSVSTVRPQQGLNRVSTVVLNSVVVPDSVTFLEADAFPLMSLSNVTLPAGISFKGSDLLASAYKESGGLADTYYRKSGTMNTFTSWYSPRYAEAQRAEMEKQQRIVKKEDRQGIVKGQGIVIIGTEKPRIVEAQRTEMEKLEKQKRLEGYIANGRAAFDRQDYDGATTAFKSVLAIDPNSTLAYRYLGDVDFIKGNYDNAIGQYSKALGITQKDALVYYHRGLAYYNKQDYTHSASDFDRAAKLNSALKIPPRDSDCVRGLDGKISVYKGVPVQTFPENAKNPYAYDENILYRTDFNVIQWIGKSFMATTGNAILRSLANESFGTSTLGSLYANALAPSTSIFIRNVSDIKQIGEYVGEAYLIYVGVESFTMANNSYQEFPIFDIVYIIPD